MESLKDILNLQRHREFIILMGFVFAFVITYVVIPVLINIAHMKNLLDVPSDRASHKVSIPTLGGLGIFIGFILSVTFWTDFSFYPKLQYIEFALIMTFFLGIKDDIVNLVAHKKALGLLVAICVLVIWGEVRITNFYGLFGVYQLNEYVSVIFSIFTIFTIVNAFNLIDGINGLCASMAIITSVFFGYWFFLEGSMASYQLVIIITSLIGALFAFLRFNISPARIFMGDTGSLIIGLFIAIFAIEFLETNLLLRLPSSPKVFSAPVLAIGVMAIPLCDMVKVFVIRLVKRRSPFMADKNHIHHVFLRLGYSHTQTTFVLSLTSIAIIALLLALKSLHMTTLLLILVAICLVVCVGPLYLLKVKEGKEGKG